MSQQHNSTANFAPGSIRDPTVPAGDLPLDDTGQTRGSSSLTCPLHSRGVLQCSCAASAPSSCSEVSDFSDQTSKPQEILPPEPQYSGFIIIRLAATWALADPQAIHNLACESLQDQREQQGWPYRWLVGKSEETTGLENLTALLAPSAGYLRPLVTLQGISVRWESESQQRILDLEAIAAKTAWPPLHSLTAYRRLDVRHLPEAAVKRTVNWLNQFPWVDLAYREYAAGDPQQPDPYEPHQHYLDRAPVGIGARWAKKYLVDKPAVNAIDLEQGWRPHSQLWDDPMPKPLYGINRHLESATGEDIYQGDHGTAVVGQLAAFQDFEGIAGIAPDTRVHLLSHFVEEIGNGQVANAITAAVDRLESGVDLSPGDVLLLEVQRGFLPTEIDHADFDATRLATALGLIVVEAAGNGGFNLDHYKDELGQAILDRRGQGRDSGAIMVGASRAKPPHDRASFSNYGSRLDCFATGEGVVTTGYGDLDNRTDSLYTQLFGGTSSAVPIVAGAALILQNVHHSATGQRLSPSQMRETLSDPATGTPQGTGVAGNIGVMPDLQAIFQHLALNPEIYLRAHPDDCGNEQPGGVTCSSPDIEVAPNGVTLSLRNRGVEPAPVEVKLYETNLSTLVLPKPGDLFENPISPSPALPGTPLQAVTINGAPQDESSFLVLVDYGQDPAPTLPPPRPYFHWEDFLAFNRQHAKRSMVETKDLSRDFEFRIMGALDQPREFDFEILMSFPATTVVDLKVPRHLAARLWQDRLPLTQQLASDNSPPPEKVVLPLPRTASIRFPRVRLASEQPYEASFHIQDAAVGSRLVLRQLFDGEEIGRITWRFIA